MPKKKKKIITKNPHYALFSRQDEKKGTHHKFFSFCVRYTNLFFLFAGYFDILMNSNVFKHFIYNRDLNTSKV